MPHGHCSLYSKIIAPFLVMAHFVMKSHSDGEYAKTFMLDVANDLFDDFSDKDKIIKQIKDMSLSANTVHDCTIMMANQVEETQVKAINAAPYFSLALDESTDLSHLSQFSVSARYAAGDTLHEESLAVLPIKRSTRGEDLFKSFTEFAKEKHLPMDKLISVCTDGAPCMVGKNRGFVGLLREHENRSILSFHCILHQEALCAQMCGEQLGEVMSLVIQVVNFIVARLELFIVDIETGRLLHFEKLREFKDQLAGFTSNLLQSFKARFEEFHEHTHLFKFITHPYECAVDKADLSYIPGVSIRDFEVDVADLKASDMWVDKFKSLNEDLERLAQQQAELANQLTVKTWNALPVTYHTRQRVSIAVLTMFGSTYACEQSFSHLKNIKTNLRSCLTDGSLNACMKLNLNALSNRLQTIINQVNHIKFT
uniref:HAT C-terminal dimerisation domain-containing protein n=1 Tax=Monopterus albus TaxID=43700 RepID=A0A3Q3QYD0_MONAL